MTCEGVCKGGMTCESVYSGVGMCGSVVDSECTTCESVKKES